MNAYDELIQQACALALRVEWGAKHIKLWGPGGMTVLSRSIKRDQGRHVLNARSALRRVGIVVPKKGAK